MEGSIVVVNQKAVTEPFNPTQFANTTLSLLSSLVTIIVLSKQMKFDEFEELMHSNGVNSLTSTRMLNTTPQAVSKLEIKNQIPNPIFKNKLIDNKFYKH